MADGQATYIECLPPLPACLPLDNNVNFKEYTKDVICPLEGIFNFNKNVINDICTLQIAMDKKGQIVNHFYSFHLLGMGQGFFLKKASSY